MTEANGKIAEGFALHEYIEIEGYLLFLLTAVYM
jgi:hypothetical protein